MSLENALDPTQYHPMCGRDGHTTSASPQCPLNRQRQKRVVGITTSNSEQNESDNNG